MSLTPLSLTPSTIPTLRKACRDALERMLTLRFSNDEPLPTSPTSSSSFPNLQTSSITTPLFVTGEWKVLIYDDATRDIISPILSVTDLRDLEITVHMSISQPRQPITDVPAIYFVQPTQPNIQRILKDIQHNLYDMYYLNFTTPLPRTLLEELAQGVVQSQATNSIAKVYDQYLDFRVLEDHFFSLAIENVLPLINRLNVSESQIDSLIDRIASSLVGVCATLGTVPYLRFPKGNAAESIARKLESKLRDSLLNSKNGLFQHDGPRSILLLLDRQSDYSVMMGHTWIYSGLMHDVLDFKMNRVSFMSTESGKLVKKSFDINSSDFFWKKYADVPFPDVAEQVDKELTQYKKEAQDLLAVSGASSIEEIQIYFQRI
ncbi:Vesicle trafficking between the ER and Golgi [Coelomomyces lativittatus]|nr:Vesicle trafficking between the ER and Golgi [Coelomomyces lativittatus]